MKHGGFLREHKELSMRRRNLCGECGGTLEKKTVVHTQAWGKQLYRFEDVPALVCAQCAHVWLSAEVSQLMDGIIQKKARPKRYQRVPVFSFPEFAGT